MDIIIQRLQKNTQKTYHMQLIGAGTKIGERIVRCVPPDQLHRHEAQQLCHYFRFYPRPMPELITALLKYKRQQTVLQWFCCQACFRG